MRFIHVFVVVLALFVCGVYTAPIHINEGEKIMPAEGIVELEKEISGKLNLFAILGRQKRETVTKKEPTNSNRDDEEVREEWLEQISEEFVGNPCATEPCKNYGKCKWRKDQTPPYVCICTSGYFGKVCDEGAADGFSISWDIAYILFGFGGALLLVPIGLLIHICRVNNRRNKMKKQFEDLVMNDQIPTHLPGILETSDQLCRMFWCCDSGEELEVKPAELGMKEQAYMKAQPKKSRGKRSEKRPMIKRSSNRQRSFREGIPFDYVPYRGATVYYSPHRLPSTISEDMSHEKNIPRTNVTSKNLRSGMAKRNKSKQKKSSFKELDRLSNRLRSFRERILFDYVPHRGTTVHYSPRRLPSTISDDLSCEKNSQSCMAKRNKSKHKISSFKDLDNLSHQMLSSTTRVLLNNLQCSIAALQSKVHNSKRKISFKYSENLPHQ